ncbi:MAG: class I mannose-6-phosphate isomerase [Verrucomicrobiae bacterium]|nr:class I mannose-6-phosphate isomerase [Verrucomicrobiae bacterium]
MVGYPLRFHPIYQQRVWGGHRLAHLYHRPLPTHEPIGESWEIAHRPDATSVVSNGPLAGQSLDDLLTRHPRDLLGDALPVSGRFPLLVKILDARDILSLQVHPPAHRAAELGGEPKTELWYFTEADPGAEILVGLRRGTSRQDFERRLADGSVAHCFHRLPVRASDAMFLPSGRVHALGAGLVLFEIQENSDTTFRVHDWNRPGLDGHPRPLHVRESLASIDFQDIEPSLLPHTWEAHGPCSVRHLAQHPSFAVHARKGPAGARDTFPLHRCTVLGIVRGTIQIAAATPLPVTEHLHPGDFCLLPACLRQARLEVVSDAEWLIATPGGNAPSPGP